MAKPRGLRVVATVISRDGRCEHGHQVGDTMEIDCLNTGGMCGWLYHDLFPHLCTLEFGGSLPWWKGDVVEEYECPDRYTKVKLRLERFRRGETAT